MLLGLDISRDDAAVILANANGESQIALRAALPHDGGSPAIWTSALNLAREAMQRAQVSPQQIRAAALSMDVPFDARGVILRGARTDGWEGFDAPSSLCEHLGIPRAVASTRAFCAARGEARFGALRDGFLRDETSREKSSDENQSRENVLRENRSRENALRGNPSGANAAASETQSSENALRENAAARENATWRADDADNNEVRENAEMHGGGAANSAASTRIESARSDSREAVNVGADARETDAQKLVASTRNQSARGGDWLYLHLDWQLGAAACVDEKMLHGQTNRALDFGAICLDRDGSLGANGTRGSLEAYCGGESFVSRAAGYGITVRSALQVWEMAPQNYAAQTLCEDYSRRLAQGIAIALTLLDVRRVVFGGAISDALGETLLAPLRLSLTEFWRAPGDTLLLESAQLGRDAAVLGAIDLAIGAATRA